LPQFPWLRRRGSFLHTARLDVRAALQTFQPGDLFALFGDRLLQGGDFAEQLNQQSFKLCTGQPGKGGRRQHMMQRVDRTESTQGKNEGFPTFLLLLRGGDPGDWSSQPGDINPVSSDSYDAFSSP